MSWASRAACLGHASLFFCNHYEPEPQRLRREAKAKALCAGCQVIEQCREEGRNERFGIWAGTTARERGYSARAIQRYPYNTRLSKQPKGIERVA